MDLMHREITECLKEDPLAIRELKAADKEAAMQSKYIHDLAQAPLYRNSKTKYYACGEDMFQDMLGAMERAKDFIFLEYFIIAEGNMLEKVLAVLERKVREGVKVRLIYDDVGSIKTCLLYTSETVCGYTNLGVAKVEGNLNVREGAGEDAELVGKMPGDAGCEILGTEGEWTQIQSGEVTGYVKSEFLITGEEAKAYAKEVMSTIATCTTETLRVREEPSTESEILALMPEGEEVEVLEDQGDWFKVLVDSEEGYVSADYVSTSCLLYTSSDRTEIVSVPVWQPIIISRIIIQR